VVHLEDRSNPSTDFSLDAAYSGDVLRSRGCTRRELSRGFRTLTGNDAAVCAENKSIMTVFPVGKGTLVAPIFYSGPGTIPCEAKGINGMNEPDCGPTDRDVCGGGQD
jgi:hypothetical protein